MFTVTTIANHNGNIMLEAYNFGLANTLLVGEVYVDKNNNVNQ